MFGEWEYHPLYGTDSRLVYRITGSGIMEITGREYCKHRI